MDELVAKGEKLIAPGGYNQWKHSGTGRAVRVRVIPFGSEFFLFSIDQFSFSLLVDAFIIGLHHIPKQAAILVNAYDN